LPINIPITVKRGINISELGKYQNIKSAYSLRNISNNTFAAVSENQTHHTIRASRTSGTNGINRTHKVQLNSEISLKKGQKISLADISDIEVCIGWNIKNPACDLDTSAFILGSDDKVLGDDWFVFYGQTKSPDNTVIYFGGQQNNSNKIRVSLGKLNQNVYKIVFVLTINEALAKNLNFSMVSDAYVKLFDNTKEICNFLLTNYYDNVTSMVIGELYKYKGQWKFNTVGDGVAKDLAGLCGMYGVNLID